MGRNHHGVGAEKPMQVRRNIRRHRWGRAMSPWRHGLSLGRRGVVWPRRQERRTARGRRDDEHIGLAAPWPSDWRPGGQAPVQNPLAVCKETYPGHSHHDRADQHDSLHVLLDVIPHSMLPENSEPSGLSTRAPTPGASTPQPNSAKRLERLELAPAVERLAPLKSAGELVPRRFTCWTLDFDFISPRIGP